MGPLVFDGLPRISPAEHMPFEVDDVGIALRGQTLLSGSRSSAALAINDDLCVG